MGIFTLFMVLIIIACAMLAIVVMAQNPKGGGLSGTFGGNSSAQFGVQRTNDFMEKATWTLGIVIVVLILLSVLVMAKPTRIAAPQQAAPAQTEIPANPTNPTNTAPAPAPAQ